MYSQSVYGIPPEQVVGSSILTKYEYQDGKPVLMREPKIFFIDDNQARLLGSTCLSASGLTRRSAIRPATSRCWSGPRRATAHG